MSGLELHRVAIDKDIALAANGSVLGSMPAQPRGLAVVIAAVAPLLMCLLLIPFRDDNTNSALLLVLLVVVVAASGIRSAGVVAALSSALWFDYFLTRPYQQFNVTSRSDIETTVLLLLVGVAVTEVALWGRRQQAKASAQKGYLEGVVGAVSAVAEGQSSSHVLIETVAVQITELLDLDNCRFDLGTGSGRPRLNRDGGMTRDGRPLDIDRTGLPTDSDIELLIQSAGRVRGRFLMVASTRVARPNLQKRLVAVALADQVGAALTAELKP